MNVLKMIDFIGTKNPNYTYDKVKDELPSKPVEDKGYYDDNGRQGEWIEFLWGSDGKLLEGFDVGTYKNDLKNGLWKLSFGGPASYLYYFFIDGEQKKVDSNKKEYEEKIRGEKYVITDYYYDTGELFKRYYDNSYRGITTSEYYSPSGDLLLRQKFKKR
jgi:hypothetical protein